MTAQLIKEFCDAIAESGITPPKYVRPGIFTRFDSDGSGAKDGFYGFYSDEYTNGFYGCNKKWGPNHIIHWRPKDSPRLTPTEQKRLEEKMQQIYEVNREKEELRRKEGAEAAKELIASGSKEGLTPYLKAKGIPKLYGDAVISGDSLVIPMYSSNGIIVGAQKIAADGEKRFVSGSTLKGSYSPISGVTETIVICEGYATGATIREATGHHVVVAFSASNLEPVADKIRKRNRDAEIIIAADDDYKTERNPGVTSASYAAKKIEGNFIRPIWPVNERPEKSTDFNDLMKDQGIEAVRKLFEPKQELLPVVQEAPKKSSASTEIIPSTTHTAKVDYALFLPDLGAKGKVIATIANFEEILRRLNGQVRWNTIKKTIELNIPGVYFQPDNRENDQISYLVSECAKFDFSTKVVPEFLQVIGGKNHYNPVVEWIESKAWDGKDRVTELIDTIKIDETIADREFLRTLIYKWLIGCVAAAYTENGVSLRGVLVLQGNQDMGKSYWFSRLVPENINAISSGVTLQPGNKDSVLKVTRNWIVELAELDATFKRSDIEAIKAFLTSNKDSIREPYSRKTSDYPRRTAFFATVNPILFLNDTTGNTRFWSVPCVSLNNDHKIDMQQCWAQIEHDFRVKKISYYLNDEERVKLNLNNEMYEGISEVDEKLRATYNWDILSPRTGEWKTATAIASEVFDDQSLIINRNLSIKVAVAVRKFNGGQYKRTEKGDRVLLVPPLRGSF